MIISSNEGDITQDNWLLIIRSILFLEDLPSVVRLFLYVFKCLNASFSEYSPAIDSERRVNIASNKRSRWILRSGFPLAIYIIISHDHDRM